MRVNTILPVVGLVMASAALVGNHALGHLQTPEAHKMAVEQFPRRVGAWTAGPNLPVDPIVTEELKSATVIDRNYTNPSGASVELTLVSADNTSDLHTPKVCMPDQGWMLADEKTVPIGADSAQYMTASQGEQQIEVLFWFTGGSRQALTAGQRLQQLRARAVGAEGAFVSNRVAGNSLFVRLIAPHSAFSHAALLDFAHAIAAPIHALPLEQRRE